MTDADALAFRALVSKYGLQATCSEFRKIIRAYAGQSPKFLPAKKAVQQLWFALTVNTSSKSTPGIPIA